MTGQPVRPAEISDLIAWAARLSRASPAETAAYLAGPKRTCWDRHRRQPRARRLGQPRHPHRPAGSRRSPRRRGRSRRPPHRRQHHHHPGGLDMIDLRNHYGFTRTPFGHDLAPCMCTTTAPPMPSRARIPPGRMPRTRDRCHHRGSRGRQDRGGPHLHRRPGPPGTRSSTCPTRRSASAGSTTVVTALGGVPRFHHATLTAQASAVLAAETAERGRLPVLKGA